MQSSVPEQSDRGLEQAAKCQELDGDARLVENVTDTKQRYAAERDKRLRKDALTQYLSLPSVDTLKHLSADPWIDSEQAKYGKSPISLENGSSCEILVLGAGFGGILAAVRLLEAGVKVEDIRMVDSAAGFGGTWYWNRYPGLMCDIESYLYLPLLEEMQYIPKHKYSYGSEIREYINSIVDKHGLRDKALLQTDVNSLKWDDDQRKWLVALQSTEPSETKTIYARFVFAVGGILNIPKVPNTKGIGAFAGPMFHTSRWDYQVTGGSQEIPELTKLKDKTVAYIGTGATALQCVSEVAKWAKKLYVVQRTPTAVDWRGQQSTDISKFSKNIANKKGWQRERNRNFNARLCNWPDIPDLDMVGDSWTSMPSYKALIGGPNSVTTPDTILSYVKSLHALDFERQARIRRRINSIVKDQKTAELLKPWYPGFCKRPSFHDDYLPVFNQSNVELVDTDGKGLDKITNDSIVVDEKEIKVDILVLSTGYHVASENIISNMPIEGRNGRTIGSKLSTGWATLHRQLSRDFPNYFMFAPLQAASGANFTFVLDRMAIHAAYILTQAKKKMAALDGVAVDRFTVEPTHDAEEDWANQCAVRAGSFAAMAGCTPGYINAEGTRDKMTIEEQMEAARLTGWGQGLEDYLKMVEVWREQGDLDGLEVTV